MIQIKWTCRASHLVSWWWAPSAWPVLSLSVVAVSWGPHPLEWQKNEQGVRKNQKTLQKPLGCAPFQLWRQRGHGVGRSWDPSCESASSTARCSSPPGLLVLNFINFMPEKKTTGHISHLKGFSQTDKGHFFLDRLCLAFDCLLLLCSRLSVSSFRLDLWIRD